MFYRSIHYLRAIAALAIVAHHAFPPEALRFLAAGVDVFFVISGFVMVKATRGGFSFSRFMGGRLLRIFPTYWLACALHGVMFYPGPLRDWFLLPVPNTTGHWPTLEPFIPPGWTLAFELQFYLLFALAGARWRLCAAAIFCIALLGMFWATPFTNPLLIEFTFGMAVANIPPAWLGRNAPILIAVGFAGFLYATATPTITHLNRLALWGLPAAALVGGLVGLERRIPENRVLHFLGDASYSIYLVHVLPQHIIEGWVGLPLGVAFGCLFYVAQERPVMRFLRSFANGSKLARQRA